MSRGSAFLVGALCGLCVLMTGCVSMIRLDVTAFHEWPDNLPDKSFAFEPTAQQQNDLEYRAYANLVRDELRRHGFAEAPDVRSARLKVAMQYNVAVRDVRVVETVVVDPYWPPAPFYGPRLYGYGYHRPFYDPFWFGPPIVEQRERRFQLFKRQLKVGISQRADLKKLYDVTVDSEGTTESLAKVMPYMVRSAFVDFPGKSGVPRRVDLKIQEN